MNRYCFSSLQIWQLFPSHDLIRKRWRGSLSEFAVLGSGPRALQGHVSTQMAHVSTLRALFFSMGSGIMKSGARNKCYSFLTIVLTLCPITFGVDGLKMHNAQKCLDLLGAVVWTIVRHSEGHLLSVSIHSFPGKALEYYWPHEPRQLKYNMGQIFSPDSIVDHCLSSISINTWYLY